MKFRAALIMLALLVAPATAMAGGGFTMTFSSSSVVQGGQAAVDFSFCLLYTSPSPRDAHESRMPSSA